MATSTYDKDVIYAFLKKIQVDINAVFNEMRMDFEKNPPVSNIKERFLKWKSRYSDIVHTTLKETVFLKDKTIDQNNFDFKDFLQKVTEDYQNDNEFLDLLKSVNTEIESLKDFIRNHLAKDSSIYYVKEI